MPYFYDITLTGFKSGSALSQDYCVLLDHKHANKFKVNGKLNGKLKDLYGHRTCTLELLGVHLDTVLLILPCLYDNAARLVLKSMDENEVVVDCMKDYLVEFWKRCPSPLIYTLIVKDSSTRSEDGETIRYSNLDAMLHDVEKKYFKQDVTIKLRGEEVATRTAGVDSDYVFIR